MKIINIFELELESLYSVQYDTELKSEFHRLFELWNDQDYLRTFFEENIGDLNNEFWGGITIDQAITKTRKESKLLERKLLRTAKLGKTEKYETLSTLFEKLSEKYIEPNYFKEKAYGFLTPSWLRIYAIRIEPNFYVISGGAIKLTQDMNSREHLLLELKKLDLSRQFLLDSNTDDLEFFTAN